MVWQAKKPDPFSRTGSRFCGSVSEYDGLVRWSDPPETFRQQDGLINNEVKTIAYDDAGRIWLGTREGIRFLRRGASVVPGCFTGEPHSGTEFTGMDQQFAAHGAFRVFFLGRNRMVNDASIRFFDVHASRMIFSSMPTASSWCVIRAAAIRNAPVGSSR